MRNRVRHQPMAQREKPSLTPAFAIPHVSKRCGSWVRVRAQAPAAGPRSSPPAVTIGRARPITCSSCDVSRETRTQQRLIGDGVRRAYMHRAARTRRNRGSRRPNAMRHPQPPEAAASAMTGTSRDVSRETRRRAVLRVRVAKGSRTLKRYTALAARGGAAAESHRRAHLRTIAPLSRRPHSIETSHQPVGGRTRQSPKAAPTITTGDQDSIRPSAPPPQHRHRGVVCATGTCMESVPVRRIASFT